jgi:small subunit ribosomal protein S17
MPRKKKEEETQPETEATEELVSEQTPAEVPAEEEKPKKRASRKKTEAAEAPAPEAEVVEVAEVDEGETERVGAVVEEPAAASEEVGAGPAPPVSEEAAPEPDASADEEAPAAEEVPVAEEAPGAEEEAPAAEEAPPAAEAAAGKKKRRRLPRAERRQRPKAKRPATTERKPIVRLPKPEHERGQRKERRGIVVSSVMDKTIVVRVDTVKPHPVYKKIVRRSTKFHAHDERNVAKTGDLVRIAESRPYSKTKNWRLVEVLEEAK